MLFVVAFSRFLAKVQDENISTLRSLTYFPIVMILYEVSAYCLWRLVSPVYPVPFRDFSRDLILTVSILAFLFSTYDLWAHNRASKREMAMLTVVNGAIIAFIMYM
jgi:hypothetical protein